MRFACEHCGRGYAVADELRGKTFKMKCKACGQVIVVKGGPFAEAAAKAGGGEGRGEPTPSPVTITGVLTGDEPLGAPGIPEEKAIAAPISGASPSRGAAWPAGAVGGGLPPPPAEPYIDLVFDDEGPGRKPVEASERRPPPLPSRRDGRGSPDPFADWKPSSEIDAGPAAEPEPRLVPPPPAAPSSASPEPWAEPPLPRAPSLELSPKVLLVAGVAAVAAVALLLFVYVGRGGTAPGSTASVTAQPAPVVAQPLTPVAEPVPVPAPAPLPAGPAPAAAERESRPKEPPKRRAEPVQRQPRQVAVAREEPRPEPEAQPARPAPPPAPEPPPAPVPAAPTTAPPASAAEPKAPSQLTSEQVARTVSANKPAFEQCIAEASRRDPGLELAGRQVTLTLTVNPNGAVASPAIDDADLDQTDLGACLKSAARIMTFPSFEGDPMKVEMPLSLGR